MSSYNSSYYGSYSRPSSTRLRSTDIGRSIMARYTKPSSSASSSLQSSSRDHSSVRDKESKTAAFVNKHTIADKSDKDESRVRGKYPDSRVLNEPYTSTKNENRTTNTCPIISNSYTAQNESDRTSSLNSARYTSTNKTDKSTNYVPTYYKYSRPTSYSRPITIALEKHKSESKIPRFGSTLTIPNTACSQRNTPSPKSISPKQHSPETNRSPRLSPAPQLSISSHSSSPLTLSSFPVSSPQTTEITDEPPEMNLKESPNSEKKINSQLILDSEASAVSINSESSESLSKDKPPKSKLSSKKKVTGKIKVKSGTKKMKPEKGEHSCNDEIEHSKSKRLTYTESFVTSTSTSSDDDNGQTKPRRTKASASRTGSSRTSVLASSSDEVTFSLDKPSRPPPSPRGQKCDSKTEEAKQFIIKALAPVKNLFKSRQNDSDATNLTESTSNNNDIVSLPNDNDSSSQQRKYCIRRIESGEKPWWIDNENIPDGIEVQSPSSENIKCDDVPKPSPNCQDWWATINESSPNSSYQDTSKSSENWWSKLNEQPKKDYSQVNSASSENWWFHGNDNKKNNSSSRQETSTSSENWWTNIKDNSSKVSNNTKSRSNDYKKSKDGEFTLNIVRIRHEDSGEKPWWLSSNQKIPDGVTKYPTCKSNSISSTDSEEFNQVNPKVYSSMQPQSRMSDQQEIPQGDRVSPEGIEDNTGRTSAIGAIKSDLQYTTNFTDIDDLIGINDNRSTGSPFMDRLLRRNIIGNRSLMRSECEEINPTQVRIHDSTPKRPVIKKVYNRCDIIDDASYDPKRMPMSS